MQQQLEIIRQKLARLKSLDKGFRVFGSASHQYNLNPCLSEAQIRRIEKKYNVILPEDYRLFLKEVGNGGAGSHYGMYPLKEGIEELNKYDQLVIDKPFPLEKKWIGSLAYYYSQYKENFYQQPEIAQENEKNLINWHGENYQTYIYDVIDQEAYFKNYVFREEETIEGAYFDALYEELDKGSLILSHIGCGGHYLLIITGNQRGTVWLQREPDYEKENNNFLDWYETWLDDELAEIDAKIKQIENLKQQIINDPTNGNLYYEIGAIYNYTLADNQQTKIFFDKALAVGNLTAYNLERIFSIYDKCKEYHQIIKYANRALKEFKKKYPEETFDDIHLYLAQAYFKTQQFRQAIAHVQSIIKKDRADGHFYYKHAAAYLLLGQSYYMLENFEIAIGYLQIILKDIHILVKEAYSWLICCYSRMGNYKEVVRYSKEAKKLFK